MELYNGYDGTEQLWRQQFRKFRLEIFQLLPSYILVDLLPTFPHNQSAPPGTGVYLCVKFGGDCSWDVGREQTYKYNNNTRQINEISAINKTTVLHNGILTKPRKQTLSTHVPQQPRKLMTAKMRPRTTRATGTWSMTTIGWVWLSMNIGDSVRDSRRTCSHMPHVINVQPPIYNIQRSVHKVCSGWVDWKVQDDYLPVVFAISRTILLLLLLLIHQHRIFRV